VSVCQTITLLDFHLEFYMQLLINCQQVLFYSYLTLDVSPSSCCDSTLGNTAVPFFFTVLFQLCCF